MQTAPPLSAVVPLPAFSDNYIWALAHEGQAAVVDPGDAAPVLRW
ncbi:hydroxyacylglutathione hydrolase, partial [Bordetella pertussis]